MIGTNAFLISFSIRLKTNTDAFSALGADRKNVAHDESVFSIRIRPPCGLFWEGRTCLNARLTPSTTTRSFSGNHPQHFGGYAFAVAGNHLYRITFFYMHCHIR